MRPKGSPSAAEGRNASVDHIFKDQKLEPHWAASKSLSFT
jgi:hypothetical protein